MYMSKGFEPCEAYPLCRAHSCDCFATFCMSQHMSSTNDDKVKGDSLMEILKDIKKNLEDEQP